MTFKICQHFTWYNLNDEVWRKQLFWKSFFKWHLSTKTSCLLQRNLVRSFTWQFSRSFSLFILISTLCILITRARYVRWTLRILYLIKKGSQFTVWQAMCALVILHLQTSFSWQPAEMWIKNACYSWFCS